MPVTFPAAFDGICASRGDDITTGEPIARHPSGGWAHPACLTRGERPLDTCPACHQTRAANGTCGCPEEDQ